MKCAALTTQHQREFRQGWRQGGPAHPSTAPVKRGCRRWHPVRSGGSDASPNSLEVTIRRKHGELEAVLTELGLEAVDERLSAATKLPLNPPYRLCNKLQDLLPLGRAALIIEVPRSGEGPEAAAALVATAKELAAAGADALAVRTDSAHTPDGLKELFMVASAVPRVPVMRWDWILHPLQVAEAKEAGAAGVIGCVANVLGKGTPLLSSYAAAIGLDAPVEVVNLAEMQAMAAMGCPLYGINLSVSLNLGIPGFAEGVARGIIGELPFGSASLVGVRSIDEARSARMGGADALLVRRECIDAWTQPGGLVHLVRELQYATSGDD